MILQIQLHTIVKILTLHTFFLSTLMSIGMLLSNPKNIKNQIFFLIFLALSLIIFYFFLFESQLVENHPYLSAICLPGILLIGPMLYFLSLYSVNKSFKLKKKQYYHFLPAIISLPIGLVSVNIIGYQHLNFFFDFFGNIIILIVGLIGSFSFMFYLLFAGKILISNYLWHYYTILKEPSALASFIVFKVFFLASITDTMAFFTRDFLFIQLSALLLSVCVLCLFLVNLVYPGFNITLSNLVEKEKHKRSYLSNIDTKTLKNKIEDLMDINLTSSMRSNNEVIFISAEEFLD